MSQHPDPQQISDVSLYIPPETAPPPITVCAREATGLTHSAGSHAPLCSDTNTLQAFLSPSAEQTEPHSRSHSPSWPR